MAHNEKEKYISIDVGFYDPFSIFQGGLRADFEKYVKVKSVYWKDPNDTLRIIKNIDFRYTEQIPHAKLDSKFVYWKLMFVCCNNIDDYRSKIRPLIVEWLKIEEELPKLPRFIFLFENSELKNVSDKYLKTNILNKLRVDFPDVSNIFKIKSLFNTETDKTESWKSICDAIRAVLPDAINIQLAKFNGDMLKTAAVYKLLNQNDDALSCFSQSFNTIPYIKKELFSNIEPLKIFKTLQNGELDQSSNNSFMRKSFLLKKQEEILLDDSLSDKVFERNLGKFGRIILAYVNSLEMCYRRNEISFLIISTFLDNKRLNTIMASQKALELITTLSNLKMLLRNELIALGISKNYIIKGSLSVIDLQFETEEYEVFNETLKQLMKSKNSFLNVIIDYTRDLIGVFNANNMKMSNLAILTTELALILFYSADDYETASDQLVKSYDFFLTNGWKYIGITLLKIYIQNLHKLIASHGNEVTSQLISSYLTLSVHNMKALDDTSFTELCMKIEKPFKFNAGNIFGIKTISQVYCKEVDVYCIDITFLSSIRVSVDKVVLTLADECNKIEFICCDVSLQHSNVLTLSCSAISFNNFDICGLKFVIGKLQLDYNFKGKVDIRLIESFVVEQNETLKNTSTSIGVPQVRDLKYEFLKMQLKVGSNCIANIQIIVFDNIDRFLIDRNTELFLETREGEEVVKLKMTKQKNTFTLTLLDIVTLQAHNVYEIKIPCLFTESNSKMRVSYELEFESIKNGSEKLSCLQMSVASVDTTLPLAVATNEIFKSAISEKKDSSPNFFFLSQYTINSVFPENPIRVQSVVLSSSESTVETWKPHKNIVAFIDQGTTFFYKVPAFKIDTVLLKIEYSTMSDEIVFLVDKLFQRYLAELIFLDLKMRICFIHAAKILWKKLKFKFNFYALTFKIQLAEKIDNNILSSVAKHLDSKDAKVFSSIVYDFFKSVEKYEIDDTTKSDVMSSSKNELDIVVDIPNVNIVATVEYKYDRKLQYKEAVPVSVCLDVYFLPFDNHNKDKRGKQNSELKCQDDLVHLDVRFYDNEQKWIIAGIKSLDLVVNLEAASRPSGQHFNFNLTFIPLKLGKIQLPAIEIKNESYKKYSMEIDYKNTTESVFVVSELNKVIHSF